MTAAPPGLPGPLRLTPALPFVGRTRELATLRALLPDAESEDGRVALLIGEPGAGKSRLVREFAQDAAAGGAVILYGACDAVVRTPYGPFVTALEQLAHVIAPDVLRSDLGSGGGELTRLLPDLRQRVGGLPDPVPGAPDSERHRLHTAVADLLASVTRRQALLLAIEDVHWADVPTLLLLRHLARSAGNTRMLLLATLRDTKRDMPDELSETLVDLRRTEGVERLTLHGLSASEVSDFVTRAVGGSADPALGELGDRISRLTDGNAFLMVELWRTLTETGAVEIVDGTARIASPLPELASPESVRDVVSERLSRLAPSTAEVLEVAAVAGPEFGLDVVRRAVGLDERVLLQALDEGVRTGMIEESPAARPEHRFTHELVRRALYDRLSALRRAELHLRVGTALEDRLGATARGLADVAYHLAAAGALGDTERAADYNLRAARTAMAALAFDQAAAHFRAALALGVKSPLEQAEIELELGTACHAAGSWGKAIEVFARAAEIGRGAGDAKLLARAAIGLEDACWGEGRPHRAALELLEEAIAALGDAESTLRIRLLSALARVLAYRGDPGRAAIIHANAMEMARRLGDQRGLATLLARAYWVRASTTLEDTLDMLTEAAALGAELGDLEIESEAHAWRVITWMALGDLEAARHDIADFLGRPHRAKQPFFSFAAEHIASAIALCKGHLNEAEARANRSRELASHLSERDASGIHGIQMFSIRREQGRLSELAPVVRVLARRDDASTAAWLPGLVAVLVELGMHDEARDELARIHAHGLEPFREALWLASLTYLTDACAALADEELAALVRPELEPYAGTVVVVGYGVACYGAADRYLGMLAATLGDWEVAEARFDAALELNRRMGARTWLAHTEYEYGRMLHARGRTEDASHADSMLTEAATLAERIGMPVLLTRVEELARPRMPALPPDGLSPREVDILRLVARGLSNRQIGEELVISSHTAANHIRSILRKTSCANRTEAATYAHRHGLAEGPTGA